MKSWFINGKSIYDTSLTEKKKFFKNILQTYMEASILWKLLEYVIKWEKKKYSQLVDDNQIRWKSPFKNKKLAA